MTVPDVTDEEFVPKHPSAACFACPLRDAPYVPSLPALNKARMAVVGEAPGATEAMTGRPFVGSSGVLLQKTLGQIIDLDKDVALLNAVSCFPGRGVKPPLKAVRACRGRLMDELAECGPSVILATGGVALQSLCNDKSLSILANRGKVTSVEIETSPAGAIPVVPTVHPAFVLREGAHYADFKHDLEDSVELLEQIESGREAVAYSWPTVTVVRDAHMAIETIKWLRANFTSLAVDIETGSYLNRIRFKTDPILCVAISYDNGREGIIFPLEVCADTRVRSWLVDLLSDPSLVLILQNGKFDQKFLNAQWGAKVRVGFDTLLSNYALDERKGVHSLEYQIEHTLKAPDYKVESNEWMREEKRQRRLANMKLRRDCKRDGRPIPQAELLPDPTYADMPRDILYRRAGLDAALTMRLAHVLAERTRQEGLWPLVQVLTQASNVYAQMEMHGLLIDHTYRAQLSREMADELVRMEHEIRALFPDFRGGNWNPHSPDQVSELLFQHLELRVPKVAWTKTKAHANEGREQKRPSTSKEVLKELRNEHVVCDMLLDLRATKKLKSSYVDNMDKLLCDCGRLHCDYGLNGTVTGRRSEPIMTVPKPKPRKPNTRSLVIAPAGKVLIEADYKAGELRVAAALSNDPIMREALLAGQDLHDRLMVELGMGTLESCIAEMNGDEREGNKLYESRRRDAKIVNFGVLYGMEEKLLAQTINQPVEVAREFLRRYWNRYQGVHEWITEVRKTALRTGKLHSPFGRVRRYGLITEGVKKDIMKEAGNYFPQEILADSTLMSLLIISEWVHERGWRGRVQPVLEMHDSLLFECDNDPTLISEFTRDLAAFMAFVPARVLSTDIPFEVEFKVGQRWGELTKYHSPLVVAGTIPDVPELWWRVSVRCGAWLPDSLRQHDSLQALPGDIPV